MRQEQALHVMLQGTSVFLTGPAGSGKTYVLNKFIAHAKAQGKQVAVTASTGIAATHIGGNTIHSWSGLGIRDELTHRDLAWLADNKRLLKRYNETDILIIDEVSMLHGKRLDMINQVAKLLRQSDAPMGGMQVILTGDLFQLPPIARYGQPIDFVHTSQAWEEINPAICYLSTQYRQKDQHLLGLLEAVRANDFSDVHAELLRERTGIKPDDEAIITRLFTHNVNVDAINDEQLEALGDVEGYVYQMEVGGAKQYVESLQKSVLAPSRLELRVGAEVMFVANNFTAGFANGTRGTVVEFVDGSPKVQLHSSHKTITVEEHIWRYEEDGHERAYVTQLPLRLAWAITIHKSQGMSLDAAIIDLSKSFTYGMGYVALSRVRSINGLYITGMNNRALLLHPDIYELDDWMRRMTAQLASEVGDVEEPTIEVVKERTVDQGLLLILKRWRTERAQADKVAPYMIAHDATLENIARLLPQSVSELNKVKGLGPKKIEQYGDDILAMTSKVA
jgi:ATP-dependent DNA helicase PIF1